MATRIMTVDAHILLLEAYLHVLEAEGYEVSAATGGLQALRQLEESTAKPDLIILDLDLRDIPGQDFLAAVRRRVEWCEVPVLIVSALVEPTPDAGTHGPQYQRYLTKLTTATELLRVVKEMLGSAGASEDADAPSLEGWRSSRLAA